MKKYVLSVLAVICACPAYAQFFLTPLGMRSKDDPEKPYVVLEFPGKTQSELFSAAKSYVVTLYKSANDVMSASEPDVISVLGGAEIYCKVGGFSRYPWNLRYKFTMAFKEGRVRLDFSVVDIYTPDMRNRCAIVRAGWGVPGIFDKYGEIISPEAKKEVEGEANELVMTLSAALNSAEGAVEDW